MKVAEKFSVSVYVIEKNKVSVWLDSILSIRHISAFWLKLW